MREKRISGLPSALARPTTIASTRRDEIVADILRPEDGQWDTIDPNRFYFTTTNAFSSPSRLWAIDFIDAADPSKGGTISMLLDGDEGQQMLPNMTVTKDGKVLLQEDVGNNAHIGKIWE